MSLSENIKRMRIEKNMTQEQLATKLGVSPQAVSKWETSETYPDGTLLVPLAGALEVSLDELFDNKQVSMKDIAMKIRRIISQTADKDRFALVRDMGWQIEKGLFNSSIEVNEAYSPDEILQQKNASCILNDYGFTFISNGKEPFFSVFPEPEEGFGNFVENIDEVQKIFAALSSADTMRALLYLHRQTSNYIFEPALLMKECAVAQDKEQNVIEDLEMLGVVKSRALDINGEIKILCYSYPSYKIIALLLVAQQIGYQGGYSLQSMWREKPFLKTKD